MGKATGANPASGVNKVGTNVCSLAVIHNQPTDCPRSTTIGFLHFQANRNYRKAKRDKIKAYKLQCKKKGIRKLSSTNAPENRINKKHQKKMAK